MTHEAADALLNKVKLADFGPPLKYETICTAYTVEKMSAWIHCNEKIFEAVVLQGRGLPRARVEGTLYNVTDDILKELDRRRGEGVYCQRKLLPVLTCWEHDRSQWPKEDRKYLEPRLIETMAWVYVGVQEYWEERIIYDQNFRYGMHRGKEFAMASRMIDENPVLHNRFAVIPVLPARRHPERPVVEAVLRNVRTRNKQFARDAWRFKLRESMEAKARSALLEAEARAEAVAKATGRNLSEFLSERYD